MTKEWMQAIGLCVFGVAFAMMVGLWTGLGHWRVLGFCLFGAFLIAGAVAVVTRGKARKSKAALSLAIALLLGPVGFNALEASTWSPVPDPEPVSPATVAAAFAECVPTPDFAMAPAAPQGYDDRVFCVIALLGIVGAGLLCIAAIAASIGNPFTWVLLMKIVGACTVALGALLLALVTCFGDSGGQEPRDEPVRFLIVPVPSG